MNRTKIEWTTFSANPLKFRDAAGRVVWGCVHASPGCKHCYAEAIAKRYGRGGPFNVPTMNGLTPFLDEAELHKMLTAKTIGGVPVSGSRCFVGDMTDIFGEWVPYETILALFGVFASRPDVTWQVLTKRASRLCNLLSSADEEIIRDCTLKATGRMIAGGWTWPLPNVWLGVSCEDQPRADERIPHLLATPAAIRWVSYEPALGPVNFMCSVPNGEGGTMPAIAGLDWIVYGGESGPHARESDIQWARDTLAQCQTAGTRFFMKQLGAEATNSAQPDGDLIRAAITGKGGDINEFPMDLRIRQYPRRSPEGDTV